MAAPNWMGRRSTTTEGFENLLENNRLRPTLGFRIARCERTIGRLFREAIQNAKRQKPRADRTARNSSINSLCRCMSATLNLWSRNDAGGGPKEAQG
jgi:hypothetical protein